MQDHLRYCQATRPVEPCGVFLQIYGDAAQVESEAKLRELLAMVILLELVT